MNGNKLIFKIYEKLKVTGFFHIFSSSVINKIVNFAYGIILVRIISKEDYGIYSYANNVYGYFVLVLGLGSAGTILQICSEDTNLQKKYNYFQFCFSYGSYINILLCIIILILSFVISLPINGSNYLLRLMGFLPIFTQFFLFYSPWLRANFKNKEYSELNIVNTLSISILSILGAFYGEAIGLILGRYCAAVVTILYAVLKLKCPMPKLLTFGQIRKSSDAKKILKTGPIICLTESLIQIIGLMGVSVLGYYVRDGAAIASFKTATTIPSALAFIPSSIMVYAFPYFTRNKDDKMWTRRNFYILMLGMFIMAFFIVSISEIFAKQIMVYIFGEQYEDSKTPFRILMVGFLINSVLRIPAANLILSQWKLGFSAAISVAGFFMTLIINVILVKNYGVIGSAYAQVLSMLIVGLVSIAYYLSVIYKID